MKDVGFAQVMTAAFLALAFVQWRRATPYEGSSVWLREVKWLGVLLLVGAPLIVWFGMTSAGVVLRTSMYVPLGFCVLSVLAVTLNFKRAEAGLGQVYWLPKVETPDCEAAMQRAAAYVGVRVPTLRLLRRPAERLATMAWAAGPIEPAIVVTEGVLHRLEPAERDSILTHEMAHVGNGSLWAYMAVIPAATTAAVLASTVSSTMALAVGGLSLASLAAFVTRPYEYACDRTACRSLGGAATAAGLRKIHRANRILERGFWWSFFNAAGTHPGLSSRLVALARIDPNVSVDAATRDAAGRQARHAAAVQIGTAAVAAIVVAHGLDVPGVSGGVALGAVAIPWAGALGRTVWHVRRLSRNVAGDREPYLSWPVLFVLTAAGGMFQMIASGDLEWGILATTALIGLIACRSGATPALAEAGLLKVMGDGAFAAAVEAVAKLPPKVSMHPRIRFRLAQALLGAGRLAEAHDTLRRLVADRPRRNDVRMLHLEVLRRLDPAQATVAAADAALLLTASAPLLATAATVLAECGDIEGARTALARAVAADADAATTAIADAVLQNAQGDPAGALAALDRALDGSPEDPDALLLRAAITGVPDDLERARRAVQTTPLALLGDRLAALEARLVRPA